MVKDQKQELVCADCSLKYYVGFTMSFVSDQELYLDFEVRDVKRTGKRVRIKEISRNTSNDSNKKGVTTAGAK